MGQQKHAPRSARAPEEKSNGAPLPRVGAGDEARADALLRVVQETLVELRRPPPRGVRVTFDSSLDRDLGLDSLARVELLLRVEQAFGMTLPENTLQVAETPRDLITALDSASPVARHDSSEPQRAAPLQPMEGMHAEPSEATTLSEVLDWHLREHADRTQVVVLSDAGEEELTYAKLKAGATAVAAGLQGEGLQPRQSVAIMLPTSAGSFPSADQTYRPKD